MNTHFFSHGIEKIKSLLHGHEEPARTNVTDKDAHYDIDGVSIGDRVIVAGDDSRFENSLKYTEYLPLSEKSLSEIQNQADSTSFALKNQKAPSEDGIPDKRDQFTSAKYSADLEEFLQFEKAGD